ncbi:ABC transporter ATP-binding protein [Streptomyces sp. NRRL S-146]|uniref:ABC transporter ATP-binding protein n=1 Tax=Streptomyces sp. NRRL S-146 TaxID=1463884 RepID=UPI000A8422B8|nr:ABC transporter ATP-binding protein [Streptomyces sp. NRRL S-146]
MPERTNSLTAGKLSADDLAAVLAPRSNAPTGKSLSVSGLRKSYSGTTVVDGVDMEIGAGEFVTFLGSSGSGKTTTLMMLAGFTEPDSGTVEVDGRDITKLNPGKRDFGFVFQQYLLFPHMTVSENVAFPLTLRGVPKAEIRRRVGETLEAAGLSKFAGRKPRELSGGQQQRVALCRVLVYRPPIVLMDEPLGALDKKLRDQMQTEIKSIQRELGLTVIYVTHDQEEALVLSDRIAIMKDGRIEQFDTPRGLFEHPRTPFVADFLGATNFLTGKVEETTADGSTPVRLDTGGILKARAHPCVPGQRVRAAVRPGKLRLVSAEEGCCSGTVETAVYVGSLTRITVRLDGAAPGTPPLRIETAAAPPRPGERVCVTADREDVSVFDESDGG